MSVPLEGTMAAADGARLHTRLWEADAPRSLVVLVHGFGDHAGRYADVGRILAARGHAVLGYDQRGHGASQGVRGDVASFDRFLDDLDVIVAEGRRRAGGSAPFVYGHSFGALVALRWLQTRRPAVPGAVLSAPWLATVLRVPRWKRLAERLLLRLAPGLAIASGADRPENLTRDPERARRYRGDPLVHHLISARFHQGVLRAQAAAAAAPLPPGVPALLLVPGADRLVDAAASLRWAREHGAGVEVRPLPEGRHEPHNDVGREAVLAGVADWLDARAGLEPGTGARVSPPRNGAGGASEGMHA